MLKNDIEECKEIARMIAREEIAKALAALAPPAPEPEVEKTKVRQGGKNVEKL